MAAGWTGRCASSPGAGGGMGREAAIVFTGEGAKVCVADLDLELAEETVSECPGDAFALRVNVARRGRRAAHVRRDRRALRRHRRPLQQRRHLARPTTPPSSTRSVEAWQRVQDVNTKGVFLCCKHGIPYLLERGGGSVINVASFVAILGAATSQISYTASKGAVLAMSKELGVAVRPRRRARERALPGAGRDAAPARDLRRRSRLRSSGGRCTGRRAVSGSLVRSSTPRSSSRATSRRS